MRKSPRTTSRRQFLGEASCATVGSVSVLSSILNLRMAGSLSASGVGDDDDYKALVCVFLAGGNDSFNMLAPTSAESREGYELARAESAYALEDFTNLNNALPDGRTLGLHNNMPELLSLYNSGKAAMVANVGTLIEPTSVAAIDDGSAKLPVGLFSHSDQQLHWQSGLPESRFPDSGWGARMTDLISDLNGVSTVSMNVSLGGVNLFQSGGQTSVFTLAPDGVPEIQGWNSAETRFANRRTAVETLLDQQYKSLYEQAFVTKKKEAIAVGQDYIAALAACPAITSPFTADNPLSAQLRGVADTLAARDALSKKRQVFFVKMGGWDHHNDASVHPGMLTQVSQGIGEFYTALEEMGLAEKVTVFSASEFGRTLAPNGDGSDHGWGGNQVIVGGGITGGKVYGDYPELGPGSVRDNGRGKMVPTTSVDELFCDLALWMGVSPTDMSAVLPNLNRFHDVVNDGQALDLYPVV